MKVKLLVLNPTGIEINSMILKPIGYHHRIAILDADDKLLGYLFINEDNEVTFEKNN